MAAKIVVVMLLVVLLQSSVLAGSLYMYNDDKWYSMHDSGASQEASAVATPFYASADASSNWYNKKQNSGSMQKILRPGFFPIAYPIIAI